MWKPTGYAYDSVSVFAPKSNLNLQEELHRNNPEIALEGALYAVVCVLGKDLKSLPKEVFPVKNKTGAQMFTEFMGPDMVMSWARVGRTLVFAVRTAEPAGAEKEQEFMARLERLGSYFTISALENMDMTLSVSVSMVFDSFDLCEQMACEALTAADFIRFMELPVMVLSPEYCDSVKTIFARKNPDYRIPNFERAIISAILNGNVAHAEQIINNLITAYLLDPLYVFPGMRSGIMNTMRVCLALVAPDPLYAADNDPRVPALANGLLSCPNERRMRELIHEYCEVLDEYIRRRRTEETGSARMTRILKYIYDNVGDPMLGAPMVCDEFDMSTTYFSRMFKEELGVNFSVFLQTVRITQAKAYLMETEMSLNEIAEKVGITTQNLSRLFKRFEGMSPSSYRQAVLEQGVSIL